MQAEVRVVASHLNLIQSPEQIGAAINNELLLDRKKVLIFKGIPAAQTVAVIYAEFAHRRDLTESRWILATKSEA